MQKNRTDKNKTYIYTLIFPQIDKISTFLKATSTLLKHGNK